MQSLITSCMHNNSISLFFFFFTWIYSVLNPYVIQQSGSTVFREWLRLKLWIRMLSLDFCLTCSRRHSALERPSKLKGWSSLLNVNLKVCVELNRRRPRWKDQHYSPWGSRLCQEKDKGRESEVSLMQRKAVLLELCSASEICQKTLILTTAA